MLIVLIEIDNYIPAWVGTVTLTKYGLWTNWTNSNKINNYVVAGEALDESMRLLSTTTGLVVQTGNTHYLFTWKNFVYPQDVIHTPSAGASVSLVLPSF